MRSALSSIYWEVVKIRASLKDLLKDYYAESAPAPDDSAREQTVLLAEKASSGLQRLQKTERIPFWRFVIGQLRFISHWSWALQIALLACMIVLTNEYGNRGSETLIVMSAAVLSVAIGIPSVFKSFESHVSELEYSCRFNCMQVLASRLVLFGLADVLWITIAVATLPSLAGVDAMRIFLYASTPFFGFCAFCFYIARITRGKSSAACFASAIVIILALWGSNALFSHWYANMSMLTWTIALILAIALAAYEVRRLIAQVAIGLVPRAPSAGR